MKSNIVKMIEIICAWVLVYISIALARNGSQFLAAMKIFWGWLVAEWWLFLLVLGVIILCFFVFNPPKSRKPQPPKKA